MFLCSPSTAPDTPPRALRSWLLAHQCLPSQARRLKRGHLGIWGRCRSHPGPWRWIRTQVPQLCWWSGRQPERGGHNGSSFLCPGFSLHEYRPLTRWLWIWYRHLLRRVDIGWSHHLCLSLSVTENNKEKIVLFLQHCSFALNQM